MEEDSARRGASLDDAGQSNNTMDDDSANSVHVYRRIPREQVLMWFTKLLNPVDAHGKSATDDDSASSSSVYVYRRMSTEQFKMWLKHLLKVVSMIPMPFGPGGLPDNFTVVFRRVYGHSVIPDMEIDEIMLLMVSDFLGPVLVDPPQLPRSFRPYTFFEQASVMHMLVCPTCHCRRDYVLSVMAERAYDWAKAIWFEICYDDDPNNEPKSRVPLSHWIQEAACKLGVFNTEPTVFTFTDSTGIARKGLNIDFNLHDWLLDLEEEAGHHKPWHVKQHFQERLAVLEHKVLDPLYLFEQHYHNYPHNYTIMDRMGIVEQKIMGPGRTLVPTGHDDDSYLS